MYPLALAAGILWWILSGENKPDPHSSDPMPGYNPTDFIKAFHLPAKASQQLTGVPWLLSISQAGLESNWGRAAFGNNFFGIKAGPGWKGATQQLKTWECGATGDAAKDHITDFVISVHKPGDTAGNASCNAAGKYSYRVLGKFRKYDTPVTGFTDHALFFKDNPRYSDALKTHDPREFARRIAKAGYATDPRYADNLIGVIDKVEALAKMMGLA